MKKHKLLKMTIKPVFYLCCMLYFNSIVLAFECEICPNNTYCFLGDNFTCPAFSSSNVKSDNIEDCICQAGYYRNSSFACLPCPIGSFCPGNNLALNCGGNRTTVALYTNSPTDCLCSPGYYEHNNVCEMCAKNSYKTTISNAACTSCVSNSELDSRGSSVNLCQCVPGYFRTTALFCDSGTGLCSNQMLCNECASGTYTTIYDASVCSNCASNSYTPNSSSCLSCPINSHSPEKSNGISSCVCNAGYEGSHGDCSACLAGYFQDGSVTQCQSCPVGTFSTGTAVQCDVCHDNSNTVNNSSESSSDCLCDPGYELTDVTKYKVLRVEGSNFVVDSPVTLVVGLQVEFDWTDIDPLHPFAICMNNVGNKVCEEADSSVISQEIDYIKKITTVTLHSTEQSLYYICKNGHGFQGVPVIFHNTKTCPAYKLQFSLC